MSPNPSLDGRKLREGAVSRSIRKSEDRPGVQLIGFRARFPEGATMQSRTIGLFILTGLFCGGNLAAQSFQQDISLSGLGILLE